MLCRFMGECCGHSLMATSQPARTIQSDQSPTATMIRSAHSACCTFCLDSGNSLTHAPQASRPARHLSPTPFHGVACCRWCFLPIREILAFAKLFDQVTSALASLLKRVAEVHRHRLYNCLGACTIQQSRKLLVAPLGPAPKSLSRFVPSDNIELIEMP